MSDGPYGRHGFSSNTGYGGQAGGPATAPNPAEADIQRLRTAKTTEQELPTVGLEAKTMARNMVPMGVLLQTTMRVETKRTMGKRQGRRALRFMH